jgi:hypothetical protein
MQFALFPGLFGGDPNGIRTRVTAVKGRCPRPLDDRVRKSAQYPEPPLWLQGISNRAGREPLQQPRRPLSRAAMLVEDGPGIASKKLPFRRVAQEGSKRIR